MMFRSAAHAWSRYTASQLAFPLGGGLWSCPANVRVAGGGSKRVFHLLGALACAVGRTMRRLGCEVESLAPGRPRSHREKRSSSLGASLPADRALAGLPSLALRPPLRSWEPGEAAKASWLAGAVAASCCCGESETSRTSKVSPSRSKPSVRGAGGPASANSRCPEADAEPALLLRPDSAVSDADVSAKAGLFAGLSSGRGGSFTFLRAGGATGETGDWGSSSSFSSLSVTAPSWSASCALSARGGGTASVVSCKAACRSPPPIPSRSSGARKEGFRSTFSKLVKFLGALCAMCICSYSSSSSSAFFRIAALTSVASNFSSRVSFSTFFVFASIFFFRAATVLTVSLRLVLRLVGLSGDKVEAVSAKLATLPPKF
mmetsp:Transcript_31629/g.69215  ORF Transcript_31629/g.69215 Transcript_31629/m.69215 type:complete len:375 (-) Transcript_31629:2777-3901(-)